MYIVVDHVTSSIIHFSILLSIVYLQSVILVLFLYVLGVTHVQNKQNMLQVAGLEQEKNIQ